MDVVYSESRGEPVQVPVGASNLREGSLHLLRLTIGFLARRTRNMPAPVPKNEVKRLNVLWQYEVLDTVPEAIFDDLTELAALICEAPVALISLVDEKRQWFKSKVGISVTETPREISFCTHAINQSDLFIVTDAAKDPRFAKNPLVTAEPKIRFYAGAPLITPDGYAVGTLCVTDRVPRVLREDQKRALRILARHIVAQLELRKRSLAAAGSCGAVVPLKTQPGKAASPKAKRRAKA